jgi:hypothetical protein
MARQLTKAKKRRKPLHPRDERSEKYDTWKKNIGEGMREAKLKRRLAGLLTPTEVCVELGLSRRAVGEIFTAVVIGGRGYFRRADVDRWKSETGASAA